MVELMPLQKNTGRASTKMQSGRNQLDNFSNKVDHSSLENIHTMGSNSIKVSTSKGKHLNNVKTNETLDRHKPALDPDTVVH